MVDDHSRATEDDPDHANMPILRRTSSSPPSWPRICMGRTTSTIAACFGLTEDVPATDAGTRPTKSSPTTKMEPMIAPMDRNWHRRGYNLEKRGRLEHRQRSARLIQPPDREFHRGADLHRRWWSRPDRILGWHTGSPAGCSMIRTTRMLRYRRLHNSERYEPNVDAGVTPHGRPSGRKGRRWFGG